MRHSSQHIGLYLLFFGLGILFSQYFDTLVGKEDDRVSSLRHDALQKERLGSFMNGLKTSLGNTSRKEQTVKQQEPAMSLDIMDQEEVKYFSVFYAITN